MHGGCRIAPSVAVIFVLTIINYTFDYKLGSVHKDKAILLFDMGLIMQRYDKTAGIGKQNLCRYRKFDKWSVCLVTRIAYCGGKNKFEHIRIFP